MLMHILLSATAFVACLVVFLVGLFANMIFAMGTHRRWWMFLAPIASLAALVGIWFFGGSFFYLLMKAIWS